MPKGRIKCVFLGHAECNYSKNCSQPSGKWITTSIALFTSSQTSEFLRGNRQSLVIVMLFCLFWGWGKISCNSVWGPKTARSHDVWATICHYTICRYCFQQTGSPLKPVEDLARTCLLRQAHRRGLMGLDRFKMVRLYLMAGTFPSHFFWGRSQYTWTACQPL